VRRIPGGEDRVYNAAMAERPATRSRARFLAAATRVILDWHRRYGLATSRERERELDEKYRDDYEQFLESLEDADVWDPDVQYAVARQQVSMYFEWAFGEPVPPNLWEEIARKELEVEEPPPERFGELGRQMLDLLRPAFASAAEAAVLAAKEYANATEEARAQKQPDGRIDALLLLAGCARAAEPDFVQQLLLELTPFEGDDATVVRALHLDEVHGIKGSMSPYVGPVGESDFDDEAASIVRHAAALAERTTGSPDIEVEHLVAALLSPDPPRGIHERLESFSIDVRELRHRVAERLRAMAAEKGATEAWGEILDAWAHGRRSATLLPPTRPTYDSDTTDGPDLLGVDRDAEAFAMLVAAKDVHPPLSIGVFGDWGSGKTFFMRRLQSFVSRLSRAARESERRQCDVGFYKNVLQVEFNAWHYAEGNLWASLVEHLFSNLRLDPKEPDSEVKKRQQALLADLEVEKGALGKARELERAAETELSDAETELETTTRELETREQRVAELTAALILEAVEIDEGLRSEVKDALSEVGVLEVGEKANDLIGAIGRAREQIDRAGGVLAPVLRARDRGKRLAWLGVAILSGPMLAALGTVVLQALQASDTAKLIGAGTATVTAWLGTGADWIRRQTKWLSEWVDRVEKARERLDAKIEERKAAIAKEIEEARQEIERLRDERNDRRREKEAAERRVQSIQDELSKTTAAHLLGSFIQDRAESEDYRKHLGLVALIRRDFHRLSKLIEASNRALETTESLEDETRSGRECINRIVLYIDDLDRCPAEKVVEVLEAVHLLLAFPLFVVVVGVDARWVRRALRKRHHDLFRRAEAYEAPAGRPTSPDDYLEKIFQIPFWLRPVGELGARRMIEGMLGDTVVRADAKPDGTGDEKADGRPTNGAPGDGGPGERGPSTTRTPGQGPPADDDREVPPPPPARIREDVEPDLEPEALRIHERELEFMDRLGAIIGRSPRAVKRFVNTYRLLKTRILAGATDETVDTYLDDLGPASPYRAVMLLLSVITGTPSASAAFFNTLLRAAPPPLRSTTEKKHPPAGTVERFLEDVEKHLGKDAESPEWKAIRAELEEPRDAWTPSELEELARWAPIVARFSFRVELGREHGLTEDDLDDLVDEALEGAVDLEVSERPLPQRPLVASRPPRPGRTRGTRRHGRRRRQ